MRDYNREWPLALWVAQSICLIGIVTIAYQLEGSFPGPLYFLGVLVLSLGLAGLGIWTIRRDADLIRRDMARLNARAHEMGDAQLSLQRMLDASGEGLLAANMDGNLRKICSSSILTWFGEPEGKVWDFLFPHDEALRIDLELCMESIRDDDIPFDMVVTQAPRRFSRGGRTYRVSLRRARFPDEEYILLTLRDITRKVVMEQADEARKEFQLILGNLVKDRVSSRSFLKDMHQIFSELSHSKVEPEYFREQLHRAKNQSALFGFSDFSERCFDLESRLDDDCTSFERRTEAQNLWRIWRESLASVESMLEDGTSDILEIDTRAYEAVLERLEDGVERAEIIEMVREWRLECTQRRLERMRHQADLMASQVGKAVDVEVRDHGVRIAMDGFQAFWNNLVHVIRNALDHGIEPADERLRLGKSERGRILLETQMDRDTLAVTIEDDGRGVNWGMIRDKARRQGLSVDSQEDLIKALCSDGVTTRAYVTELSGRGLGMKDVVRDCEALGGRLRILTTAGQGTRFEFLFPQMV